MSGCCRSASCEQMFGARFARRSLRRFREKGLGDVERELVASVVEGIEGSSVLEIGGGIGAIQTELLTAGATTGAVVELVSAYEPYALELAEERGVSARSRFLVLDLLDGPGGVEPADVVVLNRVVCCTPDGVRLTAVAARLTSDALLLSYPRDVWWVRAAVRLQNAGLWMIRRSFRAFVHRPAELTAAAVQAGLEPERTGGTTLWEYSVLRRAA